jgi:dynactin 1
MSELAIGQTVELVDGRFGTVRFVGQPHFAAGDWVGVELDDDSGKNDGSVQGERYFECEMGRGMFLRPTALTVIDRPTPVLKSANGPVAMRKTARSSSVVSSGLGRRMSSVPDAAAGKRISMNAASPSPATRGSRPSSTIRVCLVSSQKALI